MEKHSNTIQEGSYSKIIYPGVSDRIKAAITDSFVMVGFMIVLTFIFSNFEHISNSVRLVGFVFIFVLYDPLCTSLFGGTIGHMIMKIRVKRTNDHTKNILFPFAVIRYIVKILLGWISLLTVNGNEKKRAIHDLVIGSVVLYYAE